MTVTEPRSTTDFRVVTVDLYRDVHKGLRAELFAVTGAAGELDPADREGRIELAAHVGSVTSFVSSHAEHEDAVILPVLERELPALAEQITREHAYIEDRVVELDELAAAIVDAPAAEQRSIVHHLYVDLAAFTSLFLAHQDGEERVIMPALEDTVGVEAAIAMHGQIVGSIPPDELAQSLAVMLPAMNVDDRTELLGGVKAHAPAEVFAGVWSLATSVLTSADARCVAARLGL
jgi:hypothetical protein